MTPFAEHIFLGEIVEQIRGARRALRRLKRAAREGNTEAVYDDVADFCGHAALVSKILCPQKKKKRPQSTNRGEYLRRVLNIDASEPALDRHLRNRLEHVDERLEDWIVKNKPRIYIDKGFIQISFPGESVPHVRFLALNTGIYSFLDEQFDLTEIMASLDRIFDAVMRRQSSLVAVPSQGRDPFWPRNRRTEGGR
jgi:hypothetical protein